MNHYKNFQDFSNVFDIEKTYNKFGLYYFYLYISGINSVFCMINDILNELYKRFDDIQEDIFIGLLTYGNYFLLSKESFDLHSELDSIEFRIDYIELLTSELIMN